VSWFSSPPRATAPSQAALADFWGTVAARLGDWLSASRFSHWTIPARIAALALTLAVPLNLVVVAVVWHLAQAESEAQRTSLLYTARSIAAAVDAKLGQYTALAQGLARSPALLEENIGTFEAEAGRVFASIPDAWVIVADVKGQQLTNSARGPGQVLPPSTPIALAAEERAFETHSTVITDILMGIVVPDWLVNVEVPVFKDGAPFRALVVCVRARLFLRLLNDRQIPDSWLGAIIDRRGRLIARVPNNDRYVGQLASEGWRRVKDQDGVFEIHSLEGDPVVLANTHSIESRWPVAIAVKKAAIQAATWRTIRWATVLGSGLSVLSLLLAGVISRRITGPIAQLRQEATTAFTASSMPAGPPEVVDLWKALKQSAGERDRGEQALRESEERFRGIFLNAGIGIAIMDLDGRFQSCNPAYSSMLGYTEKELRELICKDLIHADDRIANKALQDRLLADEIPSFELVSRYFSKQGNILWGHRHISLLRDAANRPINIMALVTDITERKRYEDHVGLLLREVNHRSKNMLTVVQGIARQTVAANPNDFIERFADRIRALAASQDLLTKNEWKGVDLHELTCSQLGHFKDLIETRIELRGPPLLVSASAAQAIGMALHELATNAGKYGALSGDGGRIEVDWGLEPGKDGEEIFVISWHERGGPRVSPPARTGFGSTVLRHVARESLDAEVKLDYASTGLVWQLKCPAGEVMEKDPMSQG
jgi:PAS domain S-box-containing protein